jgi:hypothetical protein
VAGVLLAAATARRIEWAIFHNLSGIRVLTVARAGPDKEHFDEFVAAVRDAIANHQRKDRRADT